MAFFIRKAFRAGPVRLNLSKGGLGLSVGVTGARLGLNRKGTYVYGGRHGLYYRKQLGKGSRKNRGTTGQLQSGQTTRYGGTTDLFVDTGTTFESMFSHLKTYPLPELTENLAWFKNPILWLIIFAAGIYGIAVNLPFVWLISLLLIFILSFFLIRDHHWKKRGKNLVESAAENFEKSPEKADKEPLKIYIEHAPKRCVDRFMHDLYGILLQIAIEQPDEQHILVFNEIEKILPVPGSIKEQTKRAFLTHSLDAVLEDHLLSEEEELQMRELVQKLNLPEDFIFEEINYLNMASLVRREMEKPLKETEASIPLVRGEVCYDEFNNTRLLEERVLNRFQQNRVQYRELGFEIQLTGTLTLTDRRMVITGRGSREYRINRLANVITDLEANVIELVLTNRKNPVFLTHPTPMLIATRLEKIMETL